MPIKLSACRFLFNKSMSPNTILFASHGQETLESLLNFLGKLDKHIVTGSKVSS